MKLVDVRESYKKQLPGDDGIVLLSPAGVHFFKGASVNDIFRTFNGAVWYVSTDGELLCSYNGNICMFKAIKLGDMSVKAFKKILKRGENKTAFDKVAHDIGWKMALKKN